MGTLDQCVSTSIVSVMACGTLRGALAKSPCRSSRYRNGAGDGKSWARRPVPDHGKIQLTRSRSQKQKNSLFEGNCSRDDCSRNAVHAHPFFARTRGFCDRGNALSSRWFFPHVVRSGVPLHRGKLQLKLSLIVHYPKEKKKKKTKYHLLLVSLVHSSYMSFV